MVISLRQKKLREDAGLPHARHTVHLAASGEVIATTLSRQS